MPGQLRLARHYTGDPEKAAAGVQEAPIRAWRHRGDALLVSAPSASIWPAFSRLDGADRELLRIR